MKFLFKIGFLICLFAFGGCSPHHKQVTEWFPAGPQFSPTRSGNIKVFSSVRAIKRPFGVIGIIKSKYLPAGDKKAFNEELKQMIALSTKSGADALIIKKIDVTHNSAYASDEFIEKPHIFIHGKAVKYVDKLTKEEEDAIKQWEADPHSM